MSDAVVIALIGAIGAVVSGTLAIVINRQAAHRAEIAARKDEELSVTRDQMEEWRKLVDAKNVELDRVSAELATLRADYRRLEAEIAVAPPRRRPRTGDG